MKWIDEKITGWEKKTTFYGSILVVGMVATLIPFVMGYNSGNYNQMLWGVMIIWLCNIIFSIMHLYKCPIFLMFNICVFTFLMGAPVIKYFQKVEWAVMSQEQMYFALKALEISLLSMFIAAVAAVSTWDMVGIKYIKERSHRPQKKKKKLFDGVDRGILRKYIRIVSLFGFIATYVMVCLAGWEKVQFSRTHTYVEYYTVFQNSLPSYVYTIANFNKYYMSMYLAAMPGKAMGYVVLIMNIFITIPDLMIGVRNPLVLALLFAFMYFWLRDIWGDEKRKWIGVVEKIGLVVGVPGMMVIMNVMAYTRAGYVFNEVGGWERVRNFFESQGSSFYHLGRGYSAIPFIVNKASKNFTFGGFIDYLLHGGTAQKLFGAQPLPYANSIEMATLSNNFSHNASYIVLGKYYLNGAGIGSSYLLESYADFGYMGIAVFSIILAFLMVYIVNWTKSKTIVRYIMLICLLQLFLAPRAEATGWLTFIVKTQFWCSTATVICGFTLIYIICGVHTKSKRG